MMVCLPGFGWVFLSAVLHAAAPWGAGRPDRPRQCDAPKSVSRVGADTRTFVRKKKKKRKKGHVIRSDPIKQFVTQPKEPRKDGDTCGESSLSRLEKLLRNNYEIEIYTVTSSAAVGGNATKEIPKKPRHKCIMKVP